MQQKEIVDTPCTGKPQLALHKPFYTVTEAAEALAVPKKDVEACLRQGKLIFYKTPGGHRKIPKVALEGFHSR